MKLPAITFCIYIPPKLLPVLDRPVDLVVHGYEEGEGGQDHDGAVGGQEVAPLVHGVVPQPRGHHLQGVNDGGARVELEIKATLAVMSQRVHFSKAAI